MWAISGRAVTPVAAAGRGVVECREGMERRGETQAIGARRGNKLGTVRTSIKPVVQRLSKEEFSRLLPWSGSGERLATEVGDLEICTARVAASLVACALVYNTSIEVASLVGFYWAWAPILATALPTLLLRFRYPYAGIWSARVLYVEVLNPPTFEPDEGESLLGKFFSRLPKVPSTLQLEVGDGSAASIKMELPLTDSIPEVQVGDRVEVLVLSDEPSLSRFKALRELYFPDRQAWISEEPYIERQPYEKLQGSVNPPPQSQRRKGGADRRRTQLLLDETTLSSERGSWERAIRGDPQSDRLRESDYIMGVQEMRDRTIAKEVDDDDFYFQSGRRSGYTKDVQEMRDRRLAEEVDDDELNLQSGRGAASDYNMDVQEKKI